MIEDLRGKVAVVTGGASGVGRAMGERFLAEGMKVVLGDVEQPVLDATVAELRDQGGDVLGVVTDVADFAAVEGLRDAAYSAHGAVHVLCNNAGVGAGAAGQMWDHTINDWTWALGVNVWGVIHGIKAFVPAMLEGGEQGHVVNTSSGNGGIAPLPGTPIYALTKSAVVTLSESLYAQLRQVEAKVSASVLFPGPNVLRTGLFTSWRNRPERYVNPGTPARPPTTIESFEKSLADRGIVLDYTPVEEVAGRVVDAVRADTFWILPPSARSDEQIRARADSMLTRTNPTYIRDLGA
ncbi:MAG TPA: SDR family NAD(P)-dependent oxidoreductase [Acidimicrobiales bacterium]|nr:SDR family NAD(P)-dependent oxidoreductase [Acidimicrobiales bacterium]